MSLRVCVLCLLRTLGVLVCLGCHYKAPQTAWFKQQIYCFTVLEARNLRSKCCHCWLLLRTIRKNLFHGSFLVSSGFLEIFDIPRLLDKSFLSAFVLTCPPPCVYVSFHISPCFIRTTVTIGLRLTLMTSPLLDCLSKDPISK